MGKIFGISDLPVSTMVSGFRPATIISGQNEYYLDSYPLEFPVKTSKGADTFERAVSSGYTRFVINNMKAYSRKILK